MLLDDEELRSYKFLNPTSYIKVKNECLQRLVCDHFDTFKNECNELIAREDFDGIKRKLSRCLSEIFVLLCFLALRNMYKLLKPTHIGINYLVDKFQAHILSIGYEKVQSLKGENVCRVNGNFTFIGKI